MRGKVLHSRVGPWPYPHDAGWTGLPGANTLPYSERSQEIPMHLLCAKVLIMLLLKNTVKDLTLTLEIFATKSQNMSNFGTNTLDK